MSRKIIYYVVAKFVGSDKWDVADYIKAGYQPFGNPFIDGYKDICQGMVKYEKENIKVNGETASKLLKLIDIVKRISTEFCPVDEFQELADEDAANYVNRILRICNEEVSE